MQDNPQSLIFSFSGLIGRSWAMLFAGAGYHVAIFDVDQSRIPEALQDIRQQLETLQEMGMLRYNYQYSFLFCTCEKFVALMQ